MDVQEILRELEALGNEQTRKINLRHGAGENVFGVSFADLGRLQKQIKRDHDLALGLWESGNTDARLLATMIADPALATEQLLSEWVEQVAYYTLADVLVRNLVCKTPYAAALAARWVLHDGEWTCRCGWTTYAVLAMRENALDDTACRVLLEEIEQGIGTARNRVKDAMNNALIAIGLRNEGLEACALAAAQRIGRVVVDHGETGCKTPDATAYLRKAWARKRRK